MDTQNRLLSAIAEHIDISPSDFLLAQERYRAVKDWLMAGSYDSGFSPEVYLQGSFRLGTVVKPYRGDKDGQFDIDQVFELTQPCEQPSAYALKRDVGNRLNGRADYERMLDDEGSRCWTLEYAAAHNRPAFHLDILPSLSSQVRPGGQIDITDKGDQGYSWLVSNPKDYYQWFKSKNVYSPEFITEQKSVIFDANQTLFSRSEDVPIRLLRSPLQRAIQIMKRHRDVYFNGKNYRPISIIITTIAAQIHDSLNISQIIEKFTAYVAEGHELLLCTGSIERDSIMMYKNGVWLIPNPVIPNRGDGEMENFADKWNEDSGFAIAFFEWSQQLARDASGFSESLVSDDLNLRIKCFGDGSVYSKIVSSRLADRLTQNWGDTDELLSLIHLAVEGNFAWSAVESAAQKILDQSQSQCCEDVARVNFYQVPRHQGRELSPEAKADVDNILSRNQEDSAFVLCCHLLLGSATQKMVRDCITSRGSADVLGWPILRLAPPEILGF
ncbi:MAG TPA: hypothetical protein DCE52_18820 [Rhodobacteraceae bacterium]|nr:hypothetical protein [Paracoccaceae bacterium]